MEKIRRFLQDWANEIQCKFDVYIVDKTIIILETPNACFKDTFNKYQKIIGELGYEVKVIPNFRVKPQSFYYIKCDFEE